MKHTLCLLMLCLPFMALSQAHQPTLSSCRFYVEPPRIPGQSRAVQIDGPVCLACRKERHDKRDMEDAERKKQEEESKSKFEKEQADRATKVKELDEKNTIALADLAALKKSIEIQGEIDSRYQQQQAEINRRYTELEEKENKEYSTFLDNLQKIEKTTITKESDDFWNETVMPANYLPIQNKETGNWGYANKQGKQVIDYQFEFASPFSKGVALVKLKDNDRYNALIDTKGNIIKTFSKSYFSSISTGSMKIIDFYYPSLTNGIITANFSTDARQNKNVVGCIDKKGNLIIPPSFTRIDSFINNTAKATKFINEDNSTNKWEYRGEFFADFTYYDVGVIGNTGNWLTPPHKKMTYRYGFYRDNFYLTVESEEEKRKPAAQREAERLRFEQEWDNKYKVAMAKLEALVKAKVDAAKSQGMLTEQIK